MRELLHWEQYWVYRRKTIKLEGAILAIPLAAKEIG
jgi:hypothetical protein